MRPIIFRGKQIDNAKWVHGDLRQVEGRCFIMDYDIGDDGITDHQRVFNIHYEVDPETVGQYTGLKDINQKDIYEGDTIQFEDVGEEGYEYKEGYDFTNRAIVIFENGRFTLDEFIDTNSGVVEELADHEETFSVIRYSEVIGNRWDNPELIKEDKADVR